MVKFYFIYIVLLSNCEIKLQIAIRTKCIRCKIDDLARTVTIMSVTYRTYTKQHWQGLKERLEKWKDNLYLVDQNLTNLLAQPTAIPQLN